MLSFIGNVVDSIFGRNDAKANRQLQQDQFNQQMAYDREQWEYNKAWAESQANQTYAFNKAQADQAQANFIKNFNYQDLANKNNIQWRVEDAKKAGLHPLYALGAPTISNTVQTPSASGISGGSSGVSGGGGVSPTASPVYSNSKFGRALQQLEEKRHNDKMKSLDIELREAQIRELDSNSFINMSKTASDLAMVNNRVKSNHDDDIKMAGKTVSPHKGWSDTFRDADTLGS